MRRLRPWVRFVALLCAVLAALIGMARSLGGTQPTPYAALFTDASGRPCTQLCLFGVIPGQTGLEEAQRLIGMHPVTRRAVFDPAQSSAQRAVYVLDNFWVRLARASERSPVNEVVIYNTGPYRRSFPTGHLGDAVGYFGVPGQIGLDIRSPYRILLYPTLGVYIGGHAEFRGANPGRVKLTDHVISLHLYHPAQYERVSRAYQRMITLWQGFRPVAKYEGLAQ